MVRSIKQEIDCEVEINCWMDLDGIESGDLFKKGTATFVRNMWKMITNDKDKIMMKKMKQWMMIALLSSLVSGAWAAEVSESLKLLNTINQATTYVYNYPSKNAAGEDVVLSSALVAWSPEEPKETDSIEALHIYSHFTITADHECPTSALNLKERALFAILLKDSYGMGLDPTQDFIGHAVIIAPDYEGYGATSDVPHPYLAQELTARQVMDAVDYGLKLYQKHVNDKQVLPFKKAWRSFGFGYSQGGAVALGVQRYIEEQGLDDQLRYRGTICGDGPYDLIATMRYYIEDDGDSYGQQTDHRKGINTMPMGVPMIIKGMIDTHPDMKDHVLTEYFSQQFLDTGIMEWLESKEYVVNDIHEKWYDQLQEGLDTLGRYYSPEQMAEMFSSPREGKVAGHLDKMFTPATFAYLNNADSMATVPTEPATAQQALHRALADNSVTTGWEPQHRIQFYHSRGDMVVPFGNYEAFHNAHPGEVDNIYRINDTFGYDGDHMDVAIVFFAELSLTGNFVDNYEWISEAATPTDIDTQRMTAAQRLMNNGDNWYTIDGRRLSGKPTRKGVYIHNGVKVVVR